MKPKKILVGYTVNNPDDQKQPKAVDMYEMSEAIDVVNKHLNEGQCQAVLKLEKWQDKKEKLDSQLSELKKHHKYSNNNIQHLC